MSVPVERSDRAITARRCPVCCGSRCGRSVLATRSSRVCTSKSAGGHCRRLRSSQALRRCARHLDDLAVAPGSREQEAPRMLRCRRRRLRGRGCVGSRSDISAGSRLGVGGRASQRVRAAGTAVTRDVDSGRGQSEQIPQMRESHGANGALALCRGGTAGPCGTCRLCRQQDSITSWRPRSSDREPVPDTPPRARSSCRRRTCRHLHRTCPRYRSTCPTSTTLQPTKSERRPQGLRG